MTHGAIAVARETPEHEAFASATNANKGKFLGSGNQEKTVKRKVRQYPVNDKPQPPKKDDFASDEDHKSQSIADNVTRGDEEEPFSDTEVVDMSHTFAAPSSDY